MTDKFKPMPLVATPQMKAAGLAELERQDIPPAEMQTLWFSMSNAAPQPPALDAGPEVRRYSLVRNGLSESIGGRWMEYAEHRNACAPLQAEIERLKVWAENYAELEKVFHSERDTWNRESAANAKKSGEYRQERDQLKAQCAEQIYLLKQFHDVTIGGFLDEDHLLRLRHDLENILPKSAGGEQP